MEEDSRLIIDSLKKAAIALENQDKQTAINTLSEITDEVAHFKKAAESSENEARKMQSATTHQISELLQREGKAHADCEQAKRELDATYGEIASKKVSIQDFNLRIANSNRELEHYYDELRQHEARIADLNDTSAGSIILSILSLGLDRAIKAIAIEIDGVRDKIEIARRTIGAFTRELSILQSQLDGDNNRVNTLNAIVGQKEQQIKELDFLEFKLHNQEAIQRKRLAFFTEMNLFYIKLQDLLNNVNHRLDDIHDIVDELDNQTPTITSFDPSRHDLLSLNQAILLFGTALEQRTPLTSSEPVFDQNRWYYITSEWLGVDRPLTVDSNGNLNGVRMGKKDGNPGQLWKVEVSGNGYFKLISQLPADKRSLDVTSNNGIDFTPNMGSIANRPGQIWKIEPEFEFFRLSTLWLGENRSLDIVNDGADNKLTLADSGNYSGQHWKFIPA